MMAWRGRETYLQSGQLANLSPHDPPLHSASLVAAIERELSRRSRVVMTTRVTRCFIWRSLARVLCLVVVVALIVRFRSADREEGRRLRLH